MATTTVRLTDEEVRALDEVAPAYGGRSGALREGVRRLAADHRRRQGLLEIVADWERNNPAITGEEIAEMASVYDL